jgi:Beta-lactamase
MTKAITAMAAMQLIEQGKLLLDDRSVRLAVAIRCKADLEQTALYEPD